jgi:hypothetical protein
MRPGRSALPKPISATSLHPQPSTPFSSGRHLKSRRMKEPIDGYPEHLEASGWCFSVPVPLLASCANVMLLVRGSR